MNTLSTRTRMTIGLIGLLVNTLLVAILLGLIPDRERAVADGRQALCEVLAANTSLLVTRHDLDGLRSVLDLAARRNKDIVSIGLRRADARLMLAAGDHQAQWQPRADGRSNDLQVQVPIREGSKKWGDLEIRFRSSRPAGLIGQWLGPQGQLVLFVGAACFVLFTLYLRKILEYLDPSQVVPPHVRSALDTLAEGLLIIDARDRIVLANRSFASLVGRPAEKLTGHLAARLPWVVERSNGQPVQLPWITALAQKAPVVNATVRLKTGAGEVRTFQVNAAPVLGHKGEYRGALASFEDITPLEAKEKELRTAKDAADAANRTKSEFLANMSHDIRTPMNTILGFTDVIRRGMVSSAHEMRRYLDTIHSSGKHLLELINDILDLSKIEAGRMDFERKPCSPLELIAELVEMFSVPARTRGLALEMATAGPVPTTVQTDPMRLRQILTNLVGNAMKFTEKGGVRIVVRLLPETVKARVAIDVVDTGVGIPQASIAKIFEPFVQADSSVTRRFGGTGLGLAISRRFALALGGELMATSQEGQGSTFTVTLDPGELDGVELIEAHQVSPRSKAESLAELAVLPKLKPAYVLVADDGESNCQLITVVLNRAGVKVRCVSDGAAAISAAQAEKFDLILMDMQMPVMDGYLASTRLRQQGVTIPIVAMTAHAMKGDEEKCLAAGCSAFIAKPIDLDQLMRCLAAQLGCEPNTKAAGAEVVSPQDEAERQLREQLNAMHFACQNGQFAELAEHARTAQAAADTLGDEGIRELVRGLAAPTTSLEAERVEATIEDLAARIEARALDRARFAKTQPGQTLTQSGLDLLHASVAQEGDPARRKLVSRLPMDDPEFRPIVEGFVGRLRQQLSAMQAAQVQGNLPEVARVAHWLKGASGTVGFADLTQPAALLEQSAKQGQTVDVEELLELITDMVESIVIPPPGGTESELRVGASTS